MQKSKQKPDSQLFGGKIQSCVLRPYTRAYLPPLNRIENANINLSWFHRKAKMKRDMEYKMNKISKESIGLFL